MRTFFPLFSAITLLMGTTSMSKAASITDIDVDYEGVKEIRVLGMGSRTIIHANGDAWPSLTVTEKGGNRLLCGAKVDVSRQDDRLMINITHGALSLGLNCDVKVEMTTPPAISLSFDQSASVTDLDGDFSQITLTSPTSQINLHGRLKTFMVTGKQSLISAHIIPAREKASLVDIDVDTLVADIGYPDTLPVDYRINAAAAVFSKNIPNSAGSPHKMLLSSKVMKGSVFGFSTK